MSLIAIAGGETPLGRELRDRLVERMPGVTVALLGASTGDSVVLTDVGDEPAVISPVEADRLAEADIVICASDQATARRARQLAGGDSAPPFIDLSYGLEGLPQARLRSPVTEPSSYIPENTTVWVIAHPAASALALLLRPIQQAYPIRLAVAQIFEPASERGQAGLSELQQQVAALLSFKPLEKKVYDAQLSFNLLARYGDDAPEKLQDIENRLERHLATLLAASAPMPSLRLIQAPVFHGHTFSLWLELEQRPEMEDIEAELDAVGVEIRTADVEAPSNAGVAGQSGVTAGLIERDRNHPRGMWLWAVADNYRILSDNAATVAQEILRGEPL